MILTDTSRAYAIVVGGKIVGFSPTDTAPLPSGGVIMPVAEGDQPVARLNEQVLGPNYQITPEMVIAYYWVEPKT
jgi:hypothetical protein